MDKGLDILRGWFGLAESVDTSGLKGCSLSQALAAAGRLTLLAYDPESTQKSLLGPLTFGFTRGGAGIIHPIGSGEKISPEADKYLVCSHEVYGAAIETVAAHSEAIGDEMRDLDDPSNPPLSIADIKVGTGENQRPLGEVFRGHLLERATWLEGDGSGEDEQRIAKALREVDKLGSSSDAGEGPRRGSKKRARNANEGEAAGANATSAKAYKRLLDSLPDTAAVEVMAIPQAIATAIDNASASGASGGAGGADRISAVLHALSTFTAKLAEKFPAPIVTEVAHGDAGAEGVEGAEGAAAEQRSGGAPVEQPPEGAGRPRRGAARKSPSQGAGGAGGPRTTATDKAKEKKSPGGTNRFPGSLKPVYKRRKKNH